MEQHCSICEKNKHEVKKLLKAGDFYICNECVELPHSLLLEGEKAEGEDAKSARRPPPVMLIFSPGWHAYC